MIEANTNFCLQNQITELKAELEKITTQEHSISFYITVQF